MKMMKLIKPAEIRMLLLMLLLIVLVLAAVNVPFAIMKIRSRTGAWPPNSVSFDGLEAAALGWPSSTPHKQEWRAPDDWMRWSAFGYREYDVRSATIAEGRNGYQMSVQKLGWPLPAIEIKQMWWDWADPQLDGPEPDPRPMLVPLGVAANPVLVGVPFWMIFFVLPVLVRVARRSRRGRRGCCVWCGYEIEAQAMCPECGAERVVLSRHE